MSLCGDWEVWDTKSVQTRGGDKGVTKTLQIVSIVESADSGAEKQCPSSFI